MSVLKEKVAYLKGLANGLNLSEGKDQSKIINAIVETLDTFADEFEHMISVNETLQEQLDVIDEDLSVLEDEIYEDDELLEVNCPHCEELVTLYEDEIGENGEVECPACKKKFEVEWDFDCDCGCDCDCNDDDK